MPYGVKVKVWGNYALFSRPELKTERYSYDVMTPSAARGILDSVFWHPGMRWVIDKIYVMKPIRFIGIRRNEIKKKIPCREVSQAMQGGKKDISISSKEQIVQRASMVLKDVEYIIEAHFVMTNKANPSDNSGKFKDIILRRLRKGECYHQPYFGCREFPVNFALFEEEDVKTPYHGETRDLGLMLYDMEYTDSKEILPTFFHAVLVDGMINLNDCEVMR